MTTDPAGRSLTQRVYACLRADILDGRFSPGQRLRPGELAGLIDKHARDESVAIALWREGEAKTTTRQLAAGQLGVVLATEPAPTAVARRRQVERTLAALNRGGAWHADGLDRMCGQDAENQGEYRPGWC